MRLLFVKLSSMGDIFHSYFALSDFRAQYPNAQLDWLVDDQFSELARWHKAVDTVYTVPLRAYKKKPTAGAKQSLKNAISELRPLNYDLILDAQGLLKSALLARKANGPIAGYHFSSCREPLASLFYKRRYSISKSLHAITRTRQLMALSNGYQKQLASLPNMGLPVTNWDKPKVAPKRFGIIFPGTSWPTKHWVDEHWKILVQKLASSNFPIMIGWGTQGEYSRSLYIAAENPNVIVPPQCLSLTEMAQWIAHSSWVIGVDTGFTHLASTMNKPVIGLFGPTSSEQTGVLGENSHNIDTELPCRPCRKKHCRLSKIKEEAVCMKLISTDQIIQRLPPSQ